MTFRPNVTVAAVIRYQDHFLLVEELDRRRHVFNQPAGHLEAGESLYEAACREIKEETGLTLTPDGWLGTYMYQSPYRKFTYLRFCFYCELTTDPENTLHRILTMTSSPATGKPLMKSGQ